MIMKKLFVLFLFLFVVACAYGKHMNKGNELFEKGEYEEALKEYEAARETDPESKEAALKIQITKEKLVGEHTNAARAHLAAGEYAESIDATAAAYTKLPDNPIVLKLVKDVQEKSFERADALVKLEDYAGALALVEHLSEKLPPTTKQSNVKAATIRKEWVATLLKRAEAAKKANRKGETVLLYSKTIELTGNSELVAVRDELRNELVAENQFKLIIKGKGNGAAEVSTEILAAKNAPKAFAFLPSSSKEKDVAGTMKFKLSSKKFKIEKASTPKSVRYQSGTKNVANSAYKTKQDKVLDEEKRLLDDEKNFQKAQDDVRRYEEAVAKEGDTPNVSTGAEQNLTRARSELKSRQEKVTERKKAILAAKEELASTPQTIEEPVYAEFKYEEIVATLNGSQKVTGAIKYKSHNHSLGFEAKTSASDTTHPAHKASKLEADPLELPSKVSFYPALHHEIATYLLTDANKEFQAWRSKMMRTAKAKPTDEEKIDLYVIYILTDIDNIDPIVLAEISTLYGIPNAGAILNPAQPEEVE